VESISQGRALWVATCNSLANLSDELKRRFKLAKFFFDLPDAAERESIWKIYLGKFQLKEKWTVVDSAGWTGAEIEECCHKAWNLEIPLTEAAKYIVASTKSDGDNIEARRRQASGRFLSASKPGVYQWEPPTPQVAASQTRSLRKVVE